MAKSRKPHPKDPYSRKSVTGRRASTPLLWGPMGLLRGVDPSKPPADPNAPHEITGDSPELNDYIPNMKGCYSHSTFSSPEVFSRHIESLDRSKAWDACGWDEGEKFYGTNNMREAIDLGINGWKEGADQVENVRNYIKTLYPTHYRAIKYGIAGSVPSVPRAVAGNIFNMRNDDLAKSKKRPIITLVSHMGALGYVKKESLTNRAAVVAALIDEIESKGFSCEVIATAVSTGASNFTTATSVVVKRSDQSVDICRLAFGLGHASVFRRFVFADRGTSAFCRGKLGYGMGSTAKIDREGLAEIGAYVLPSCNECPSNFETPELAGTKGLKFLVNELRKQGCPAFEKWTEKEELAAQQNQEIEDPEEEPFIW